MAVLKHNWGPSSNFGSKPCSRLDGEGFCIVYYETQTLQYGLLTVFHDHSTGRIGVLRGDWRREFDEVVDEGRDSLLQLFCELHKDFGVNASEELAWVIW